MVRLIFLNGEWRILFERNEVRGEDRSVLILFGRHRNQNPPNSSGGAIQILHTPSYGVYDRALTEAVQRYRAAQTKGEKSQIIDQIVDFLFDRFFVVSWNLHMRNPISSGNGEPLEVFCSLNKGEFRVKVQQGLKSRSRLAIAPPALLPTQNREHIVQTNLVPLQVLKSICQGTRMPAVDSVPARPIRMGVAPSDASPGTMLSLAFVDALNYDYELARSREDHERKDAIKSAIVSALQFCGFSIFVSRDGNELEDRRVKQILDQRLRDAARLRRHLRIDLGEIGEP